MTIDQTTDESQPEALLTVEDVARQLRVSQGLIYSWLNQGKLRGAKLPGRAHGIWRITPAAVQQFLREFG